MQTALLIFFTAAARAGIVTTDILKGITHRLLVGMTAVRTVYMAVLVVVVIVVMVAIGAMHMVLLVHRFYSAIKSGAHYPANHGQAVSRYYGSHNVTF